MCLAWKCLWYETQQLWQKCKVLHSTTEAPADIHTHSHTLTHTHTHTHSYTQIHIHTHTRAHTHKHSLTHTHTHTHTHKCIFTQRLAQTITYRRSCTYILI